MSESKPPIDSQYIEALAAFAAEGVAFFRAGSRQDDDSAAGQQATSTVAAGCAAEGKGSAPSATPCFSLSTDDSSRNVAGLVVAGTDAATAVAESVTVEAALASALHRAAEAGRFDVVAQLARELEARRLALAGNVVRLDERNRTRVS